MNFGYICFLMIFVVNLVLDLAWLIIWPNTCGSRPRLVSKMDFGIEKLLTKSVIGDRL